ALGIDFLVPGLDRLGFWGPNGGKNISWGDWHHFSIYAHQVMFFLPYNAAEFLAILATVFEISFAPLLIFGLFTRWVALGSGILTACFAISMAFAFGFTSPINYSVFAASAGSFLLASLPEYPWSLDNLIRRKMSFRTQKTKLIIF
ncbi:MAG TPA: DoxX family protein, partial [Puia sp.]|nr:DoxX family protein [Puia sp.]